MSGFMRACAWDATPTHIWLKAEQPWGVGGWKIRSARRGMQSAACIQLLYHPTVQYSHCHILVAVETYGEVCLLLGIPVWVFTSSACSDCRFNPRGRLASGTLGRDVNGSILFRLLRKGGPSLPPQLLLVVFKGVDADKCRRYFVAAAVAVE